jgi:hypothetical protein
MNPLSLLLGWKGYAAAAAVALLVGFGGGWKARDLVADAADWQRAKAALKAAQINAARIGVADKITADVGRKAEDRQVEIRTVTKTLIREVPIYVTAETDRSYPVPVGLVRLHDAAALGLPAALPDPAGRADDAPSGVAASTLGETVADNYGTCRANAAQLDALEEWVRQQQAAWALPDPR